MPFQAGNKHGKGRIVKSKSKKPSTAIRDILKEFSVKSMPKLFALIEAIKDPAEQAKYRIDIIKNVLPRLAVENAATDTGDRPIVLTLNLGNTPEAITGNEIDGQEQPLMLDEGYALAPEVILQPAKPLEDDFRPNIKDYPNVPDRWIY